MVQDLQSQFLQGHRLILNWKFYALAQYVVGSMRDNCKNNFHSGHLMLRDGVISHNWPQIASDRTIWGKSPNLFKNAKFK